MKDQSPELIKLALIDILAAIPGINHVSALPITSKHLSSMQLPAIEVYWASDTLKIGAINAWVKDTATVFLRIYLSDPIAQDTGMAAKKLCNLIAKTILKGNVRLPDQTGTSTCVSCNPNVIDAPLVSASMKGRAIIQMELAVMYYYRT